MFDGVNGVKLRSIRFAGKRLTTAQWCDEFVAAIAALDPTAAADHHEANAALDAMGV
jgi:hypothetical protein